MNQWYNEFWKENKKLITIQIILTIIIFPFEIILFSVFTKKLFRSLQESKFKIFCRLFIVFIIFLSILQIIYGWKEYIDNHITPRVQIFVRERCMNKYLLERKEKFQNAEAMNKITNFPKCFYANYESLLKFWIPFLCCFFFYTLFLYWIDIHVGIVSTFVFISLLTLFIVLFQKLSIYSSEILSGHQKLLAEYENVLINNETVQSFYNHIDELKILKEKEEEYESHRIKLVLYIDIVKFSFIVFIFMFLLLIFFYLYHRLLKKEYPPWKFITFITILFFVMRFILTLISNFQRTVQIQGSLKDIEALYVQKDNFIEKKKLKNYQINFNNISFSYPINPSKVILNNFSLSIPFRSNILIKGSIGAGKSTIARLLALWYKPQKGSITVGDIDIYSIPKKQYKDIFYMMSQNTILFSNKTIFENICYSYKDLPPKDILKKYNLPESFLKILDQKVLHHGTNISGGQKRMVHILRIVLNPSPIVILDEPTDSLDEKTSNIIISLIEQLKKERTVICISHDERLNSIFSRIIHL